MSTLYLNNFSAANQSVMPSFTFRHILENTDHYLIEVRNDLLFDGVIAPNFQWLKISKDFVHTAPLMLQAIDSSWDIEERFFQEGYLKFGQHTGVFIEKFNSGQHQYQILNNLQGLSLFDSILQHYFSDYKAMLN